jgi:hypothetical protein
MKMSMGIRITGIFRIGGIFTEKKELLKMKRQKCPVPGF